jgi:hypothetical protein
VIERNTIMSYKKTYNYFLSCHLRTTLVCSLLLLTAASCRKPYNPPAINPPTSYLVVEGVINTAGSTIIKLSRTVNLASANTTNPVDGATLTIVSSQNVPYSLNEIAPGIYQTAALSLDNSQLYHLNILTSDNQQYQSDPESVQTNPPIDSIGFSVTANSMQVYVNNHDPTNNTKYYRWDYNETWQFHSKYGSDYIATDSSIVTRGPSQDISDCFASDTSSTIVLASSADLKTDIIYQALLTAVPSTSEKIETEYSVQVNQYALTAGEYNFWTNLKKTTEQLGSIFDPLPTNISGNIHNIKNATEPVIGFVGICMVQTKRIFIAASQLPHAWQPVYPYDCMLDSNYFSAPVTGVNEVKTNIEQGGGATIPTEMFFIDGAPAGYLSSDIDCVDCTIRGTKIQPSFWRAL